MNRAINEFLELLRSEAIVAVDIDEPGHAAGEWWIDLVIDTMKTNVSWTKTLGFGIYTKEAAYGARPNEIYRKASLASARILQLAAQWRSHEQVHAFRLKELRHLVGETQIGVASSLGMDQARVSRIESSKDLKLSALISYLEAIGATLELKAHFPSFEAAIEPIDLSQIKIRSKQLA